VPAGLPAWKLRRAAVLRSRDTRGDAAAFTALYERHHQALYRYCRSILNHDEDARDALQSTMTKAFAALQREERDFDLRPWLFRIAHNEAISLLRRRRDAVTLELAETVGSDSLPAAVESRERLARLREDLADLPVRQRSALVLRELNGLGHEEIATVLESSPRAIKQTIFEARTSLGECDEGREMPCAEIQRMLSDADGRVLRGRRVRAHLRSCKHCRQFKAALAQRPAELAMLAPPLPAAAAAGLLASIGGGTAAAAAGTGAGVGASAGGTALASKLVAIVTVTATAAGGTVAATEVVRHHPSKTSHQTDRAPRQVTSPTHSSSLPGRSGSGVPDRVRGSRAGRGALDRPARRKSDPAVEAGAPGRASPPSHVSRPERARGGGRPDRPAPPAGKSPAKNPKPPKPAKTPKQRGNGHAKPKPTTKAPNPRSGAPAKPVETPAPNAPKARPNRGTGNGNRPE
jgi:RNA polymerase sigma factor (sigma-70 family)